MRACVHVGAVWLTNLPSLLVTMLLLHASLGGVAHGSEHDTHAQRLRGLKSLGHEYLLNSFGSFKYFSYLGLFSYDRPGLVQNLFLDSGRCVQAVKTQLPPSDVSAK